VAKLSIRERLEIAAAYHSKRRPCEIARQYGVSPQYVVVTAKMNPVREARQEPPKVRMACATAPSGGFARQAVRIILPQQVGSGRTSQGGYLKLI